MAEEKYDICISCGKITSYKKTDNIIYRSGYIEGAGQLCFICTQTRKLHKTGNYDIDPQWIKEKLNGIPIQGGLDPKILLTDKEKIKKTTENYLNIFSDYPYIFNLGHGVIPETKPETIEYIIQIVRNKN